MWKTGHFIYSFVATFDTTDLNGQEWLDDYSGDDKSEDDKSEANKSKNDNSGDDKSKVDKSEDDNSENDNLENNNSEDDNSENDLTTFVLIPLYINEKENEKKTISSAFDHRLNRGMSGDENRAREKLRFVCVCVCKW